MSWNVLVAALAVFGVSLLAPLVLRPVLTKWGVVDVPSARSSHTVTTLRAGGIAPLVGWGVGVAIGTVLLPENIVLFMVAGSATVALAVLGFVDDLRSLPAGLRLAIQVLIGCAATTAAGEIPYGWATIPLGTLLIVGYVNATNFMDGIDGLSGMHGAVVGSAFLWIGLLTNTDWLSYVGVVIAAAFVAFLPWNLRRSGFFLGDVGSYALGGSIAVTAVLAIGHGLSPLLILAPLAVYIADTGVTMARRVLRGEKITSPHRTHAYQRLTDTGLSHVAAASVVTGFAALNTVIAVLVTISGGPAWCGVLAIAAVCLVYLAIPRWRGSQLASNMPIIPSAPEVRTVPASLGHSALSWAVLGPTGFVGSAVVAELRRIGLDVREVRAPRLLLHGGADVNLDSYLAEAVSHPEIGSLAEQLEDVDVVVNAAGMAAPDSEAIESLFGANALLPAVVAEAAINAGAKRIVHLSSAAVQGRRRRLDATSDVAPFSPYSQSKALGERLLLAIAERVRTPQIIILRATSVQGQGRRTTEQLRRLAYSPLASVASDGNLPSVVSSISRLAETVVDLGRTSDEVPGIVLQPWEGLSTRRVLEAAAAGRVPKALPTGVCRSIIASGFLIGRIAPRMVGVTRRLEVMWFGQDQVPGWRQPTDVLESRELLRILGGDYAND